MIPKTSKTDTDQVVRGLKLVGAQESEKTTPARPVLRPELRAEFEASWERNEEAYRYLGR